MTRQLNKILGFYMPSFFRLHINTDSSLTHLENLSDKDFSTFLHEYIHFVQDITTIYGLNNIHVMAEYMRDSITKTTKLSKGKFATPIYPDTNNANLVFLNKHIQSLTYGDSNVVQNVSNLLSVSFNDDPLNKIPNTPPQLKAIKSVCLEYDSNGNTEFYSFGASSIMESMAYLMEQVTCQGYAKSPDLPYDSAQIVANKIYPEFGVNQLNIIALCDISLNLSNPGKVFVEILNDWKSRKEIPLSPEDLYDEFYNKQFIINNIEFVNWETMFKSQLDSAKEQLFKYFNHEHFNPILKWISHIFEISKSYRINNKSFIIDIARQGQIRINKNFINLYQQVGTPLMSNNHNEYFFYNPITTNIKGEPSAEIGYFLAINQIYDVFQGNTSCKLTPFCSQKESNAKPDHRCLNAPWSRCNSNEELCPFAALWKHWGLLGYVPKPN